MRMSIIGYIRRENGVWYAGYTESRSLVEFRLMNDTSPKIVGMLKDAAEVGGMVNMDVNDIAEFHGVKK